MLQDGESGGAAASSAESSGMIIRGGAGGDNVSSSGEVGGSTTGGCGSADVGVIGRAMGREDNYDLDEASQRQRPIASARR